MEGGREFQIDDPENARLILNRSMRGRGAIKLLEPYLLVDLVKSERMYSGERGGERGEGKRECVCVSARVVRMYACVCVCVCVCVYVLGIG